MMWTGQQTRYYPLPSVARQDLQANFDSPYNFPRFSGFAARCVDQEAVNLLNEKAVTQLQERFGDVKIEYVDEHGRFQ